MSIPPVRNRAKLALGVLLSSAVAAVAAGFATPTITCPYAPGREPARFVLQGQPLILNDGAALATRMAYTYFYYDEAALYVGPSWHTAMDQLQPGVTMPDGTRKRDAERIRILLKPDRDAGPVYEVAVAASCRVSERLWRDGRADESWTTGATARNERWKNDYYWNRVTIPWAALGGRPEPGAEWGFNYAREEAVSGEHSNWAGVVGDDKLLTQLGVLRFADPAASWLCGWYFPTPLSTNSRLTCGIKGNDGTMTSQILIAEPDGPAFQWAEKVLAPAAPYRWYEHEFTLPRGMPLRVQSVLRHHGRIVSATPPVPLPQPRAGEMLEELTARLAQLQDGAGRIAAAAARARFLAAVQPLRTRVAALSGAVAGVANEPHSIARTRAIDTASANLETLDHRTHLLAGSLQAFRALPAESTTPGFSVGTTHSLVKLRRFQADVRYGQALHLELARRERESGQLVVVPFEQALTSVSATWTDLRGPNGATLPADAVRIDTVGYVQTQPGGYPTPWIGWWPDPLLPLAPTDVPADQVQPLWVTVYAAADTPAGRYLGTITVTSANAGTCEVPLTVDVWDYALPLRGRLKTAFGSMFSRTVSVWYGYGWMKNSIKTPQQIPQDVRRRIYAFLLEHRINPCGLYEQHVFPDQEDVDFCLERGLNLLMLSYSPNASDADMVAYLEDWREFLRQRDALGVACIYGWDEIESRPQQFEDMVTEWTALKRLFPDIPFASTIMHPHPEWDEFIDIWIPHVAAYDPEEWAAHLQKSPNDEVWWYTTCETSPYPGVLTDVPAIKHRILFWHNYQYGLPGYLYYAALEWTGNQNDPAKPRWPEVPWVPNKVHGGHNGCGQLVYPGPDGLLASIRLAVIRDGIEDYETFVVLEELTRELDTAKRNPDLAAANRRMLEIPPEVSRSFRDYTADPLLLLRVRRELAHQIVRTRQELNRTGP